MMLGQLVKQAIHESDFKTEDVADFIGITPNNLYRLYKKDSFEVKYLIKIAEKLNLPLGYFLNDETIGAITQGGSGNQLQQATNVGKNRQQISMGADDDCPKQLEVLQEKYELQKQLLVEKERTITLLMGQGRQQ
jgi:transcriptional regulator with XRE-family HTH domain